MKQTPHSPKPSSPSPQSVTPREALLRHIRDAKLPADAEKFRLEELSAARLTLGYIRPARWSDSDFRLMVLLATQVKELRREMDRLRPKAAVGKDWKAMPWVKSLLEPCPVKKAEIERQAQEEKRIADEQQRKQLGLKSEAALQAVASRRKWESRDEQDDLHYFRPALWHEPMTLLDYHAATGISRRTLKNILDRAAMRPIGGRVRPNDPSRYGQQANAHVLCHWLTLYVEDSARRKALIARTLLHCEHEAPEHFKPLLEAIYPAFESLGVRHEEFVHYMAECRQLLYPAQPRSPDPNLDPYAYLYRLLTHTAASS